MPRPRSTGPTDRELDLLAVLWNHGPSTVRDVHQALGEDAGFTTIQTMLQVMHDKSLVTRQKKGRTYVYRAAVTEEQTQRTLVTDLLERAFGGSAKVLVSRALDAHPASEEELAEIEELIRQAREERHDGA